MPTSSVPNSMPPNSETLHTWVHGKAMRQISRWPELRTLQPTALVNEVVLKLLRSGVWQQLNSTMNAEQAAAILSRAMRDVVIDSVRSRRSKKRGGGRRRQPLIDIADQAQDRGIDLAALDEALTSLATTHPRPAQVVEMKFFGGFTTREIADALRISIATVESDWRLARGWLFMALSSGE